MLDEEEYASDTDESDEDYKPGGEDDDAPSEIDSDGDAEDDDNGVESKSRKRKAVETPVNTKRGRQSDVIETKVTEKDVLEDDEDDNEDALWASFMSNTGQTAKKVEKTIKPAQSQPSKTKTSNGSTSKAQIQKPAVKTEKRVVTEIFEFAGEKVEVQKEIKVSDESATSSNSSNSRAKATGPSFGKSRTSGGLSSVLGQIGKNNKLSVLEKTAIDWTGFKRNEGIDEELQTHNKGRDGYLERQDFLQRTDLRRFEIEKDMRAVNRRK